MASNAKPTPDIPPGSSPDDWEDVRPTNGPQANPAPAPGGYGLGAMYTRGIGGPANDFISNFLKQGDVPPALSKILAGIIAPETLTDAGMTAGVVLVPEAKMAQVVGSEARNAASVVPMLKRVLSPAAGGAAGGLAEKGDPVDAITGGVTGAVAGLTGEALSAAGTWLAKSRLGQRFFKEDPEKVGAVVGKLVKEFPQVTNPKEFGEAFWGRAAQDKLSDMYDRELTGVSDAVGTIAKKQFRLSTPEVLPIPVVDANGAVTSPTIRRLQQDGIIGPESDFDSLAQAVRDLRLKGRAANGDPKVTFQGRQANDYARLLSDDVAAALDTVSRGLAKRYQDMDRRYARGAEMLRYLKQPGVVDENGQLDMRLLQDQFKEERRAGLEHDFTPAEIGELSDAVFRGGDPTVSDVIRRGNTARPHSRESVAGMAKASMVTKLFDMIRGNDYAGKYDLGFPYASPKAATLGVMRPAMSTWETLNKRPAITLAAPRDDEQP